MNGKAGTTTAQVLDSMNKQINMFFIYCRSPPSRLVELQTNNYQD
jgi:hypothetical protein